MCSSGGTQECQGLTKEMSNVVVARTGHTADEGQNLQWGKKKEYYALPSQVLTWSGWASIHFCAASS